MGSPIDFFSGVNRDLQRLLQERFQQQSPQAQLANAQLQKIKADTVKADMISNVLDNVEINPNDPSSITGVTQQLAAIDDRFVGTFVGSLQSEARETKATNIRMQKTAQAKSFADELREAGLGTTASAVQANIAGVAPDSLVSSIFKEEFGNINDQTDSEFKITEARLANDFTPESLNLFRESGGDFTVLIPKPDEDGKKKFGDITPSKLEALQGQMQATGIFQAIANEREFFGAPEPEDILKLQSEIALQGLNEKKVSEELGRKLTELEKTELNFINQSVSPAFQRFQRLITGKESLTGTQSPVEKLKAKPGATPKVDVSQMRSFAKEEILKRPFAADAIKAEFKRLTGVDY